MSRRLPTLAHDHSVMRFVLGDAGMLGDLSKTGALTEMFRGALTRPLTPEAMAARRRSVRERFGWEALGPKYFEMFRAAAGAPL